MWTFLTKASWNGCVNWQVLLFQVLPTISALISSFGSLFCTSWINDSHHHLGLVVLSVLSIGVLPTYFDLLILSIGSPPYLFVWCSLHHHRINEVNQYQWSWHEIVLNCHSLTQSTLLSQVGSIIRSYLYCTLYLLKIHLELSKWNFVFVLISRAHFQHRTPEALRCHFLGSCD